MKEKVMKWMVGFCFLLFAWSGMTAMAADASEQSEMYNGKKWKQGDYTYQYFDAFQGAFVAEYTGNEKVIRVPDQVDGVPVKGLMFNSMMVPEAEEIVLPDGIVSIGPGAFQGCENLKKINIPEGITSLEWTFYKCKSLTSITLPESLASIGRFTFMGCTGLKKITIPDNVTAIKWNAFAGCEALETVELSSELRMIGKGAFQNCKSLKKIKFPKKVYCVDKRAFNGCKRLEKVTLSGNMSRLSQQVFRNCVSLKEITIPSEVRVIEFQAFAGCKKLQKIRIKGSGIWTVRQGAFQGIHSNAVFDVPKKAIGRYKEIFKSDTGFRSSSMTIK